MVYKFRACTLALLSGLFFSVGFLSSAAETSSSEYGYAKLLTVRNKTPHPMLFYSQSRGLAAGLPDGATVRIKALKTGTGKYYKAEKVAGAWLLKASAKDAKDTASQFLISKIGKYLTLTSETADGLMLASSPQTYAVMFISDNDVKSDSKKADWTLWELVEDQQSGDTLSSCYLKNKATGGMLTAQYEGGAVGDTLTLKSQIETLEKDTPYITITYARTESFKNGNFESDLSRNIKGELDKRIQNYVSDLNGSKLYDVDGVGNVLTVPAGNWVAEWSGISKARWNAATWRSRPRHVKIKYMEGNDKTEKEKVFEQIEGKALQIIADPTKHRAWALRKKLEGLEKAQIGSKKLATSDIACTGYLSGIPEIPPQFTETQWSKVSVEAVVSLDDDDDQGAPKQTIAGGGESKLDIWAHKHPEFKGAGQLDLPDFGPEMVITVNSQSIAWLSESLPIPGRGTIFFRALADQGDVSVCFSDSVAPYVVYRVVFGAAGNSKTIIYKNNVPVQEISNEQNENARIAPGMIEKYWVSLNNGFIIVGKNDPGSIILMAWQDPDPAKGIERVGFSSAMPAVKYTDVQKIADPIVMVAPQIPYVVDNNPIQVGTKEAPAWSSMSLSPADACTIVFQATGGEEANLVLANDQNDGYIISFGADGNTCTKIIDLAEGGELYGVYSTVAAMKPSADDVTAITAKLPTAVEPVAAKSDADKPAVDKTETEKPAADKPVAKLAPSIKTSALSSLAILDKNKPNKFWVSYYKGRIILGKGEVGKNPFCIYVDADAPKGISKIGFSGKATLKNLEIWPEMETGFEEEKSEYVKEREFSAFKCTLNVISPYNYSIYQEGTQVTFKDRLSGMVYKMAGTPNPGANYFFMLDIEKNGIPNIQLQFEDPSPQSIKLQARVTMAEGQKDAMMRVSQNLAYGTGSDIISNMVALGASGLAGAAGSVWAAEQAAAQSKLSELQQMANRYIYTEKIDQAAKGATEIRTEAVRNRQALESKLEAILQLQLQDAAQLDYATKQWDDVLRLVTDFYVVEDKSVKTKLSDGLKEAYDAVKSLDLTTVSLPIYNRMINCLMKAYNNAYLTKSGDAADDARRKDWYLWINTLSRTLFSSPALMALGIDINFKGEYLWFPVAFTQPGKGSVSFEARAFNNIFVAFSENPYQVRNMASRMYEIVIGKWDNKTFAIHRKSLGDTVFEFNLSEKPDLTPEPSEFKKYWINIDNGKISGGVGALGQNKLWEWQDPYPAAPVKWVGFSNWLSLNTFKNIKVGYPFVASSGFKPIASVVEVPAVESPAVESSAVESPVVAEKKAVVAKVKPAAKKPVAKKTMVKKTMVKKTAAKPVAKKTVAK